MRSLCPVCGRPGCTEHARQRQGGRSPRTRAQEAARAAQEPWRAAYGSTAYRRARQAAIARLGGSCAVCGRKVFERGADGTWRACVPGAGVHHARKLSGGGAAAQPDMVPVCPACHARLDRGGAS